MSDEQPDPELNETPADAAFRDTAPSFLGKLLEPWGRVRKTAAEALGMKHGLRLTADDVYEKPNPFFAKLQEAKAFLESGAGSDEEKDAAKATVTELKDAPETMQFYTGIENDVGIVLWLCSQPDSVCQRARRKPRDYESAVDKWCDENRVLYPNKEFMEALEIFYGLLNAEAVSKGVPSDDKKGRAGPAPKN